MDLVEESVSLVIVVVCDEANVVVVVVVKVGGTSKESRELSLLPSNKTLSDERSTNKTL